MKLLLSRLFGDHPNDIPGNLTCYLTRLGQFSARCPESVISVMRGTLAWFDHWVMLDSAHLCLHKEFKMVISR